MCLTKVDQVFSGRGTKVYTGWKVFDTYPGRLHFEYIPHNGDFRVPLNQWLTSNLSPVASRILRINNLPKYSLGFHIFDTKEGALIWANSNRIRQVWYKGILAKGCQNSRNTIKVTVAKHLYVRGRRKRPEAPK